MIKYIRQAEDEILAQQDLASQEESPNSHEKKKAMAAARRSRQNAHKLAARLYDGLRTLICPGSHILPNAFIFHFTCGRRMGSLPSHWQLVRLSVCMSVCIF